MTHWSLPRGNDFKKFCFFRLLQAPLVKMLNTFKLSVVFLKERVTGIEPISSAWKAGNLPLIYTRFI